MGNQYFKKAEAVWQSGRQTEMNVTLGFRCVFDAVKASDVILKLAASSIYRIYLNNQFVSHGPARGPHDYYRVDEIDLKKFLENGQNLLIIEVAGYNMNSYYLLDQPSFLQAELEADHEVICATLKDGGFEAFEIKGRVQKVQRFSFQRTFTEVYRLDDKYDQYRKDSHMTVAAVPLEEVGLKNLIDRNIIHSTYMKEEPISMAGHGVIHENVIPEKYIDSPFLNKVNDQYKGYKVEELQFHFSKYLDELKTVTLISETENYVPPVKIEDKEFRIFELENLITGFLGLSVHVTSPSRLVMMFDEILIDNEVDIKRAGCVNALYYELDKGDYLLESFEPYSYKFIKLACFEGSVILNQLYVRKYENAIEDIDHLIIDDFELNEVYKAGVRTFKQNSSDIFMDCPSRERAGWLCDSFFTARVEKALTNQNIVEKNFLENFLLPSQFKCLPDGMFPMCYPSDHYNGMFIPNWALWLVIELEDYHKRTGDTELIKQFKTKIYKLFDYFKKFLNEYGLLEKLESWVFVEWSKANSFTQDVNFPSNMLYYGALKAASQLYHDSKLETQAALLKKSILELSFNGTFFIDNAMRENNQLVMTENTSEVCQYYAFFFDVASKETHHELFHTLITSFGPKRDTAFPEVHKANAFIGNYLRLDILLSNGYQDKMLNEIKDYFYYMAKNTGTLWEFDSKIASLNHGFASYVVYLMKKANLK
ncbi:MAG: hypothetical protein JXQ23_13480 [Clostridia bacterium]|nr:hypothetical protein [Clostridia bacterium]